MKRSNEFEGAVYYAVDDPYPGSQVIAWLSESLEKLNWTEADPVVQEDPRGRTRDWSRAQEGGKDVFRWVASWKNTSGDYVTYWLTYEVKGPDSRAVRMNVKAIRMSAATVKRLRESFGKAKEKKGV